MDIDQLDSKAGEVAELLNAMASPKRLIVLCNLVEQERTVTELVEFSGLSQPALSQHLAKLRALKLVNTRREGNVIYYSLASKEVEAILATLYQLFCADG